MILESIKTDGSLLFQEVNAFMVRDDGSVQVREIDGNLLDISDFSVYARLRLMSNEGRVYHTVRDDVPEPESVKPVSGGPNVIRPEDWR